jgi:RHS repeat-associated protein
LSSTSTTSSAVCATTVGFLQPHSTGKERDAESGNDYFGARYYASTMGRFMSPDPLMASAHISNPQSWNRYAYVFNNPLLLIDPNGMDVSSSCATDKYCQITVKINVIYDKTATKLSKADLNDFKKNFLDKAQKDFGNSNIKLQLSLTAGSYTNDGDDRHITGIKSDSLNFVVSDHQPGLTDGSSTTANRVALSFINIQGLANGDGPNSANYFFDSNVFEHELGQQFLGDTAKSAQPGENYGKQAEIDPRNTFQSIGFSQSAYRTGLESKYYATATNPEANKPQ